MATAAPGTLTPSKVNPGAWPIPGTPAEMTGKLRGVEIQGKEGDPVRSISKGKVMATGPYRGFSQVVIVERDEKIIYIYGGQGRIFVAPGDIIQAGTILGELGMDSKAGKALMYFVVYVNGKAIDPANAPRD
jgi:septal ring factor EnvC (AmiA/AmiB activator)